MLSGSASIILRDSTAEQNRNTSALANSVSPPTSARVRSSIAPTWLTRSITRPRLTMALSTAKAVSSKLAATS